jgi:predicted site-specific integrase-resolvase
MRETCMNQTELAARWKISPRTLERWRWMGDGHQFLKICGRVIYRNEDVDCSIPKSLIVTQVGTAPRRWSGHPHPSR